MQGVRSVKKVSYKHELLSYAQARALYLKTESFASSKSGCCRDFIINRWRLGNYFERALPKNSLEKIPWIQMYWPEASEQSMLFWINFARECPHYVLNMLSTEELRRAFLEKAIIATHLHPEVIQEPQGVVHQEESNIHGGGFFRMNLFVKKFIKQFVAGAHFRHSKN